MTVEIRHLRYFVTVAEKLHFTRAAEELHVAQPALSHQIKRLEASLHLQLLDRNTRAVTMTEAGQEFLLVARQAVAAYDAAIMMAQRLRSGEDARLRFGTNQRFGHQRVSQITDAISASGPRVALDIVAEATALLQADIADGRLDFALCLAAWPAPGLVIETLIEESLSVVLPAGHELADRESVSLSDLAGLTWMLPNDRKAKGFNDVVRAWARTEGIRIRQSPVHPDYDNAFALVAAGSGIELVPSSFVGERELPGVAVVPLEERYQLPVSLVWREDNVDPTLTVSLEAVRRALRAPALA